MSHVQIQYAPLRFDTGHTVMQCRCSTFSASFVERHQLACDSSWLADVFQSMQGLQRFRCSHNRLPAAGVPWATLSLLPRLSHVQVASNCLTFLDPVLCQASSLRLLDLSANSLESLPADIGNLQHLEELDVSDNKLRSLPESLGVSPACDCSAISHRGKWEEPGHVLTQCHHTV